MDIAAEYNNRAMVPEHPAIIAAWHADAKAYREHANPESAIRYGARPRNAYDLFRPAGDKDGAMVLFIHGGYWRAFDRSMFSHMAAGANAHGISVAVAGYTLCPEVTVPDIIDELRQCVIHLGSTQGRRLVVVGHSAGGHLAACMAATDWTAYGQSAGLVQACFAISGLFDLRPLMATEFNADLKLDAATAMAASPLFWPVPQRIPLDSWVGSRESFEFKRNARSLAAAWAGLGHDCRYAEVPGENHFSVANGLADPSSQMTRRLVELCR
jgi:arylformamidase